MALEIGFTVFCVVQKRPEMLPEVFPHLLVLQDVLQLDLNVQTGKGRVEVFNGSANRLFGNDL